MSRLQHSVDTPKKTHSIAFEPPQYYQPQHPLFQQAEPKENKTAHVLIEELSDYITTQKQKNKKKKIHNLDTIDLDILNSLEEQAKAIKEKDISPSTNIDDIKRLLRIICKSFEPELNTQKRGVELGEGGRNVKDFKIFVMCQIQKRCHNSRYPNKSKTKRDIEYWVDFLLSHSYLPETVKFKKSLTLTPQTLIKLIKAYVQINTKYKVEEGLNYPLVFEGTKKLSTIKGLYEKKEGGDPVAAERFERYFDTHLPAIKTEIKQTLEKFRQELRKKTKGKNKKFIFPQDQFKESKSC